MLDDKTAKKAGLGYTIGNVLLKGIIFLSLPIFTRLMSPADFGLYNNYIAYEGILSGIMCLGLYSCIKKAIFDYKDKFNSFFSAILSSMIFTYILFLLLSLIFQKYIVDFTGFNIYIIIILLSQSFCSAIIQLYASKLNAEFKYKEYLIISAINSISNVGLSVLFIFSFSFYPWVSRIIGTAVPYLVLGIYLIIKSYLKGKVFFNKNYVAYSLKISLPLIPHVLSQYVLNQSDRIMISKLIGNNESGIYSFVYSVCTILYIVLISLESAWTPWTYNCYENDDVPRVRMAGRRLMILSLCLFIGFVSICPEIYKLIGEKTYWDGIKMIIPLSLSMLMFFFYSFPVGIEYYHKKTVFVSIATCIAAAINIVLNFILIPKFGYTAAAYTTLISYSVMFFIHLLISLKYDIHKIYDLSLVFVIILIALAYSIMLFFIDIDSIFNYLVRYVFIIFDIIFMIFYYKNDIKKIRRK